MDGRSASKSIQPEDRRVLKKICLRELRDSTTYSVQFFFGFEVAPRPGSRSYLSLRDSKRSFGMKQCPDIDRFQRDKSDPSVVVFSEIKRCQLPHSTHFFQKAKREGWVVGGLELRCPYPIPPNFRRSVLGCIEAKLCK